MNFEKWPTFHGMAPHRRRKASQRVARVYLLKKSQQCGQLNSHDGRFPYSPAMLIAALVIRNIAKSGFFAVPPKTLELHIPLRYYTVDTFGS